MLKEHARFCTGLCKTNKELFSKKHYGYDNGSYCKHCEYFVKIPTTRKVPIGIAIAPLPSIDRHPEIKIGRSFYDKKGWKHTILERLTLLQEAFVEKVPCPCCKRITKGTKVNKNRGKKPKENPNPKLTTEQIDLLRKRCKESEYKTLEVLLKKANEYDPNENVTDYYGNVKIRNQLKGVQQLIDEKIVPMQTLTEIREQEEHKIKNTVDYFIDEIKNSYGQERQIFSSELDHLIQFIEDDNYSSGDRFGNLETICQCSDSDKMRKKYTRYMCKKLLKTLSIEYIDKLKEDNIGFSQIIMNYQGNGDNGLQK